jgi:hypothetical protein
MAKTSEAHYQVARLLTLPTANEILSSHRWPYEHERWHELVACLFVASLSLPDRQVRRIVDLLRVLGLLDLEEWAEAPAAEDNDVTRRTLSVLAEQEVDGEQAQHAVTALHEVSHILKSRYHGKIQVCLRSLSEVILASMLHEFQLTGLQRAGTKEALTLWLQNVANLPISVDDDHVRRFCELHEIKQGDLVQAADELDVNVAVLDDLIELWIRSQDERAQHDEGEPES